MIFLVDHHAKLLARIDGDAAGAVRIRVLPADQLTLDEELAVDLFQRANVDIDQLPRELAGAMQRGHAVAQNLADLIAIALGSPRNERKVREIAGQPDAAGDDDVRLRSAAAKPFTATLG